MKILMLYKLDSNLIEKKEISTYPCKIGRSLENDIVVLHPSVDMFHCEIIIKDGILDWLKLIGLIHDICKIIFLKG